MPDRVETQPSAEAAARDEGSSHRPGKGPAGGQAQGSKSVGWPSPYYLAKSELGTWAKARDMMIGKLPLTGGHEGEPNHAHRFVLAKGLDALSSVFESRYVQAKAVEQFSLPKDEELLRGVPDIGLHVILRSYLTRGCLVEQELHRRLAQGHHAYETLQKAGVRTGGAEDAEFDRVVSDLSSKQAELDDWRREMEVKDRLIAELRASDLKKSVEIQQLRRKLQHSSRESSSDVSIAKALRERDLAVTQAAMEKQVAESAKSRLEEELAGKRKLHERCAQLEEALRLSDSKVSHLESPAHESAIVAKSRAAVIEEFRESTLGKLEVTLACKAGYDYVMAQLPAELRKPSDRLRYPPSIADHIGLLTDMENAGGGYDLGEGGDEDEPETASSRSSSDSSGETGKNGGANSVGK